MMMQRRDNVAEAFHRTWKLNQLQLVILRAVPPDDHKTTINYCSWCNTEGQVLAGEPPTHRPTCVLVGTGGVRREALERVRVWRNDSDASHPAGAVLQLHHDGSDRQTVGTGQWKRYGYKCRSDVGLKCGLSFFPQGGYTGRICQIWCTVRLINKQV